MGLVRLPAADLDPAKQRLLQSFTGLKDIQLRTKWETAEGVYLAESHNVIERALVAGHTPLAFLLIPRWLEPLRHLLTEHGVPTDKDSIPIFVAEAEESALITGYPVHRGALALFARPAPNDPDRVLEQARSSRLAPVAVLEGLVDHTNVGALFRSAAALGVGAILLSPDCADPLYRRSVRVSMGAVFQIPWARLTSWPTTDIFRARNYHTAALTPRSGALPLDSFIDSFRVKYPSSGLALLLGSEGPGLRKETLESADSRVQIPLASGIDSLNVSTAGALAFWEARKLSTH